jgi:hypothetical protein
MQMWGILAHLSPGFIPFVAFIVFIAFAVC